MRRAAFSSQIAVILLGRFLSDFGRGFSVPYLPLYFQEEVGLPVRMIGLGFLLNAVVGGLAVFGGAYWTDRRGRKSSLCASMLASAAVSALYPAVGSASAFLAVSTLAGVALSLYWPASLALLTDICRPSERGTVFGWLRAAANSGMGLGSLGGALVLELVGKYAESPRAPYHILFYVNAATYFAFFLLLAVFVRETLPEEAGRRYAGFRTGWAEALRDRALGVLSGANVCFVLCYSLFFVGFTTFFRQDAGMSFTGIAVVLGVNAAIVGLLQAPIWALVDPWRRSASLVLSASFFAAGLLILHLVAVAPGAGFAVALAALSAFGFGQILHGPAVSSLYANLAPVHLRGTYMGVQTLCWSAGLGVGPVVTGAFFDAGRPYVLFAALAGVLLGAAAVLAAFARRLPEAVDRPVERRGEEGAPASLPRHPLPPPRAALPRRRRCFDPVKGWFRRIESRASLFLARKVWPRVPGAHVPYERILRRGLAVGEAEVPLPGLPEPFEGLRILLATDVHTGPFLSRPGVDDLVSKLAAIECDLVVFGGDLASGRVEDFAPCADLFRRFRAPLGAFAVLGNHEYLTGDPEGMRREIAAAGLELLANRSVALERGGAVLYLAGVDDLLLGSADLDAALRGIPRGAPAILVSHNPDVFFEAAGRGVPLVLSGHTHGGQIRIPGLPVIVRMSRFRLDEGRYRQGDSELVVSRGLGAIGLPLRIACPPEAVLLTLRAPRPGGG